MDDREKIQTAVDEAGFTVGLWFDDPPRLEARLGRHRATSDASETFVKGDEGTLAAMVNEQGEVAFMMLEDGEGVAHEVDPSKLELVSPTPSEMM